MISQRDRFSIVAAFGLGIALLAAGPAPILPAGGGTGFNGTPPATAGQFFVCQSATLCLPKTPTGDVTAISTAGAFTVASIGGVSIGTSGNTIPKNSSNNTLSGVNSFIGTLKVGMRVITAAGAVTVSATTDYFICLNKSSGAATVVNLPASPTAGQTYLVKDCKGDAQTNAITITPNSGTIDGASTFIINTNHGSAAVTFTGGEWAVN